MLQFGKFGKDKENDMARKKRLVRPNDLKASRSKTSSGGASHRPQESKKGYGRRYGITRRSY